MASRNGSLIAPHTFREFMTPNYRRIASFAREHGIEAVLVDSDGERWPPVTMLALFDSRSIDDLKKSPDG